MGLRFDVGNNPGAIGLKWQSGTQSFANDLLFLGPWDCPKDHRHLHSVLVRNGGGGIFKNIWAPDSRTDCPLRIENTKAAGRVYQISLEHHTANELMLDGVKNWSFYAMQTEEDRGSELTLPISIKDSSDIQFANTVCYRTTGVWEPHPTAIRTRDVSDLTVLGMWMHSGRPFAFDHTLIDESTSMVITQNAFTWFQMK